MTVNRMLISVTSFTISPCASNYELRITNYECNAKIKAMEEYQIINFCYEINSYLYSIRYNFALTSALIFAFHS